MPNRVLLQIGPIVIYWYGFLIVIGILVATWIAGIQARHNGDNPEHVWNALILCLLLGVIGARLYHVVSAWQYYLAHPNEIFGFQMAGFGIYGAVAGGALGLWIYTRRHQLSFWRWADYVAPGMAIAQAIGRWGNFFNQELYGYPTTLPWGIYIAPENRLPGFEQYERFHPTFLYESLWDLLTFAVLIIVSRKMKKWLRTGDLFLLYGVLYPLGRFFVEFQRPDAWKIAGMPTAQWIAIVAILACGSALVYRHRKPVLSAPKQKAV